MAHNLTPLLKEHTMSEQDTYKQVLELLVKCHTPQEAVSVLINLLAIMIQTSSRDGQQAEAFDEIVEALGNSIDFNSNKETIQ